MRRKNPTKKELWAKVSSLEKRLGNSDLTSGQDSSEDDTPSIADISATIARAEKSLKTPGPAKQSQSKKDDPYAAAAAAVQAAIKRKCV